MQQVHHFLDGFFRPKTVAVIGATNNPYKFNTRLVKNLIGMGFQGKIFPVNPNVREIDGIKTFSRLRDIDESIDLVVSAVRVTSTLEVVRECAEVGVQRLVVVTGGFSEAGEEGLRLQEELASLVKGAGIRTLGPNTLSPVNTANNLIISLHHVKAMSRGHLSLVFQSGFYEPRLNWIFSNLGINKILDMGNKIDINEVDALEYLAMDPDTRVIGIHLESIKGDTRKFCQLLREVSQQKPLIILKSGRTKAGSRAAVSHTGSLAGENDNVFDGLVKQTAAIRAHTWEEFFDLAKAFSYIDDPPKGNGVAIIATSGGEGVMATDACEFNGLRLSSFSSGTYQRLREIFPPWEIPVNPLDGGVCLQFHTTKLFHLLETLCAIPEDDDVSGVIMQMPSDVFSSDPRSDQSRRFVDAMTDGIVGLKKTGKPFALWRSALDAQEEELIWHIQARGVPVFDSAERAIRAFAAMKSREQRCRALAEGE